MRAAGLFQRICLGVGVVVCTAAVARAREPVPSDPTPEEIARTAPPAGPLAMPLNATDDEDPVPGGDAPSPDVPDPPADDAAAEAAAAAEEADAASEEADAASEEADAASEEADAQPDAKKVDPEGDAPDAPVEAPRYDLADPPGDLAPVERGHRRRMERLPITGSFRFLHRLRTTGDDTDNDLYQYLHVNVGREDCPGWSGALHGRLAEDLDGRTDTSGFYVFDSVNDTFDSAVTGQLYSAYVSYRPARGPVEMVRVGRQYLEAGDLFHLDGARVDFEMPAAGGSWKASVFGGVPAHIYEDSPDGDLLVGFGVERCWDTGMVRFDYAHVEDETSYYGDTVNDVFTITARQRINRALSIWGAYQQIDDDPTSLRGHFDAHFVSTDVSVRGSFYALFREQNERVNELDPYFAIVQELQQYWTGSFAVSKGLGQCFYLEGGLSVRRLFDDDDEGVYNRTFERYYVSLSSDDWPCRNLFLTVTGEMWESDDKYHAIAFELEHRPSKKMRFRAGTDYALYRFDLYAVQERQSVRGYYVEARWKPNRRWRLHARLRVEDDAFDTYVTLRTGFDLEF